MAEKVAKIGLKREPGYLYFLRNAEVWKAPMKRKASGSGAAAPEAGAVKVQSCSFTREPGYLYFLDKEGDVARAVRQVGGKARKKSK